MIVKGITFDNRAQEIEYMLKNKAEITQVKKAAIKYADPAAAQAILNAGVTEVAKALSTSTADDTPDAIKRTIIGNTYFWMDSHNDVHLGSTFTKSLQERGDKVLHLHDHLYQVTAKVGKPIKTYEQQVSWKDLGVNRAGNTVALMMDTEILKGYNPLVFDQYKEAQIDQHSVGMYYVNIQLAADNQDYEEEYKRYTSLIDQLGNPERAEEKGYFWAVSEAKLIEISAVLEGSNTLTPTVEAKSEQELAKEKADKLAAEKDSAYKNVLLKQLGC